MKMYKYIWVAICMVLLLSACTTAQPKDNSQGIETPQAPTWQEQYDLGVRYLSEGNYQEAIIAFTAAIEIDPKRAPAYVGRGDAYVKSGETDENLAAALADYEKAIELDRTIEDAYVGLANVYVCQGDLGKAEEILQEGANYVESSSKIEDRLKNLEQIKQSNPPEHESKKVEEIRFDRFEEQGVEYAVITGVNSANEVQWTYTTIRSDMTELTQMEEIGLENGLYYFNERGTIVALEPDSGKVVWKNDEFGGCSISYDFGENGDLFLSGYYGPDFFWVNANGKTVKRIENVDKQYFWPDGIKYKNGHVEITMRGTPDGYGEHILTVNLEKNEQTNNSAWRRAYLQYIQDEDVNPFVSELFDAEFQLIYVDGDDIPELWICCSNIAAGSLICTFDGKEVNDMFISEYGDLKYIERTGQFYTCGGHMDVYWDGIYVLQNGQFVETAHGDYGAEDNANVQYDRNGRPIYVYNWDGKKMTEQEYKDALERSFNVTAARDIFDGFSYDYYQLQQMLLE